MNYQQSKQILEEIKKAKRILLNCHRNPDPDSIGSALALYRVLVDMGKDVKVVCPTDIADKKLVFLENFDKIEKIDFSTFDFSQYDLFIALDSSSWDMVSNIPEMKPPSLPIVVIDHHKTNTLYGIVNLVDDSITSTGELLFRVLEDNEVKLDKVIGASLLTGIIGDTGVFRYPRVGADTLETASKLIRLGADKDLIVSELYGTAEMDLLKFWGEILAKMELDQSGKFVWSAISYEKYKELGSSKIGRESASSMFAQIVKGTEFGIIMTEQEPQVLSMSLRSRTGFDTSKIATALGGGGHIYASGAKVVGLPFDEAVEKVLQVARKFAKEK